MAYEFSRDPSTVVILRSNKYHHINHDRKCLRKVFPSVVMMSITCQTEMVKDKLTMSIRGTMADPYCGFIWTFRSERKNRIRQTHLLINVGEKLALLATHSNGSIQEIEHGSHVDSTRFIGRLRQRLGL